ncbi:mercury methylation ferredoxin HgcB [Elusimicrobiota bacterium]
MKKQKYLKNVTTLELNKEKCTGCGICEIVCPHGVFKAAGDKAEVYDKDLCMECGACVLNCPVNAIKVSAGVGCAAAVINGILKGSEPSCDCSCGPDKDNNSCC